MASGYPAASRILVFRLGSIGDTVISLPCFHLLRRNYPQAEIALLTNDPVSTQAAPAASVLAGTGLVDDVISYPAGTRNPFRLVSLRQEISRMMPELLVYLRETGAAGFAARDRLFFHWCGVVNTVGLPKKTTPKPACGPDGLWPSEAALLAAKLAALGDIDLQSPENWDLHLTPAELAQADSLLRDWRDNTRADLRFLGISIGTKQDINDWGDGNWRAVLSALQPLRDRGFGLVLVGGNEDRARSETLAEAWGGPRLNLCGLISPRATAAVLRRMELFLCHDSGPMHLSAAVGTRCVAVFSRKNPPGKWFPFGRGHSIFYPPRAGDTIQAIKTSAVIASTMRALEAPVSSALV